MKESLKKFNSFLLKYHLYYYLGMVAFLALDLVTKKCFESLLLENGGRIEVIKDFFDLALVYNTGAFSGFLGGNLAGRIILVLLSLVCGVVMTYCFHKYYARINLTEKIGLLMAIPGTFGNLIDRFLMVCGLQQGVIDFLEFDLGFMVWNTFNIADSLLVVGLILFAIGFLVRSYHEDKEEKKKKETKTDEVVETKEEDHE